MIGSQIAPLIVTDFDPPLTRDSAGFATANDGRTYVLKTQSVHPLLPANEAFCEALAVACQLPVATGAWLQMPDGTECYGSRREWGIEQPFSQAIKQPQLAYAAIERRWKNIAKPQVASGIFALDLFLFNYDRHFDNYLYQDQGGNMTILAIDYSKSFLVVSALPDNLPQPVEMKLIPAQDERTYLAFNKIRRWVGFDLPHAQSTLNLLRRVPATWVETICKSMPQSWLPNDAQGAIVKWWGSTNWLSRIETIENGLKDGSLL
jgi:hypothetical protein